MKKLGKIFTMVIFGMLVLVNFACAMPAGTVDDAGSKDGTTEMDWEEPDKSELYIPVDPLAPDDPGISGSPPAPPVPTGFDSPITDPLTGVRPLLSILLEYTDLRHPGVVTPRFVQNQVFGPRPSVNDYYLETSYGQFSFSDQGHWAWITAWDDPATTANATSNNDESTWQYWSNFSDPWNGGTFYRWVLKSLDETGYDFTTLDFDTDGTLNFGPEIAYLLVGTTPFGLRGGATRWLPPGMTLDGKTITGVGAGVPADSPWITLYSHELAHQTTATLGWPLIDYYAIKPQIIGFFSLMGWSGSSGWAGQTGPHHLDPPSKAKLGWYTPTVVTRDGWVDIDDAETNPVAYILHDPAHGTEEYYMIENRWKGTSYDNTDALIPALTPPYPPANGATDIPDEGLLVWHVDETRQWNGSATGGYPRVNLTRRGGTDSTAAFNGDDADYYDFWSGSSPESAIWNDGTNSNTGMWCVSGAGPTMRAYLDVPGPGIFMCSARLDEVTAVPGFTEIALVPLVNTGDTSDTFTFTGSWPKEVMVTLPQNLTVASKAKITFSVGLTPLRDWTTIPGPRIIQITATSTLDPTVTDTIEITLNVAPFGEPQVNVLGNIADLEPGNTASFDVELVNHGNVADTLMLSFMGLDFGGAYQALPTAIPNSWVTFNPANPSVPVCGSTVSTMTIDVPSDWAGMEDAKYEFIVTATSSITPDDDSDSGQLTVHATPESMMFWVKAEIIQLRDDVEALPPSDVRDGLHDKATAALNKINQSIERYLLGDDPPASNLFRTTKNMLRAFLHLVEAQRGKALTDMEADYFSASAQKIRDDIDEILAVI